MLPFCWVTLWQNQENSQQQSCFKSWLHQVSHYKTNTELSYGCILWVNLQGNKKRIFPSWLPRGSCGVLLSLIRRFFGIFGVFVQILSWILSVRGGLNQTCSDEQFDIKIIPIPLADVERLRSNRFYGFWRFRFGFWEGGGFSLF